MLLQASDSEIFEILFHTNSSLQKDLTDLLYKWLNYVNKNYKNCAKKII